MKKEILERYEHTDIGEIIIDISTKKVEDLYSNFDKKSHFLKKDLNQDLVEYIIDSANEIEQENFIIRFNFETEVDNEATASVVNSVNRFFTYLQEHEHRKMKDMLKKSISLFIVGVVIAGISAFMSQSILMEKSILFAVIAEGLTVAAWVSLWESLATFLIRWMPYKKKILLYERIANAKIVFSINIK
ncbi:MAG: hypothetical protein A3E21_06730 [Sulfurimonas sp. RIFCSPHIGHO2_12_FULL_36_9]|uniref:hypothetical protein n=1 Tax=Sulfurimonas sp. RIFCSPLOWO2_12_36_12 TaxID=1802253 RepID=UPI0008D11B0F|nr:hypothetical protein [Sulfurimonas sp. RIFCSPLOWO2_12_36_12]OHD99122.1 MAG: hypothetical protein A3E21_06730 [Sulfurimonas sp. RIFCSPHIGHO2_12_FULL_36_9]OHE02182.1 MAG: hypothetical protein A2W82_01235 [Sulfurimonas sp. RIFCSPLOWO2_12_36_12]OHE07490.1 MAG: hypothetical protein A3K14_08880 [Sulfurimonas sp. RIFCSPLOWO2_12_FULL_36_74]